MPKKTVKDKTAKQKTADAGKKKIRKKIEKRASKFIEAVDEGKNVIGPSATKTILVRAFKKARKSSSKRSAGGIDAIFVEASRARSKGGRFGSKAKAGPGPGH